MHVELRGAVNVMPGRKSKEGDKEMNLPYAEKINYWKTSRSSPDIWMQRAKEQIEKFGGKVLAEGFGSKSDGQAAYMIGFEMDNNKFKVIWPVLQSEDNNEKAARIQAATMLYHDIKAKCISATVWGARHAFFSYLLLPDGRTAGEVTEKEIIEGIPEQLLLTKIE